MEQNIEEKQKENIKRENDEKPDKPGVPEVELEKDDKKNKEKDGKTSNEDKIYKENISENEEIGNTEWRGK